MNRLTLFALLLGGACTAGPTTGQTFTGQTNGTTMSFFGYTDMKLTPVTAYVQTKPYCAPVGGAWTQIGTGTTGASAVGGMNDPSRPAYQWNVSSGALSSNQWKQGGLARFKVKSKINGGSTPTELLGFDTDGPACAYDAIQNGSTGIAAPGDGMLLVNTATMTVLDKLSYESAIMVTITGFGLVDLVENTFTPVGDDPAAPSSMVRIPNGTDTNNALNDWAATATLTPGIANVP